MLKEETEESDLEEEVLEEEDESEDEREQPEIRQIPEAPSRVRIISSDAGLLDKVEGGVQSTTPTITPQTTREAEEAPRVVNYSGSQTGEDAQAQSYEIHKMEAPILESSRNSGNQQFLDPGRATAGGSRNWNEGQLVSPEAREARRGLPFEGKEKKYKEAKFRKST